MEKSEMASLCSLERWPGGGYQSPGKVMVVSLFWGNSTWYIGTQGLRRACTHRGMAQYGESEPVWSEQDTYVG